MALLPPHGGRLIDRVLRGKQRETALEQAVRLPCLELDADAATDVINIATGVFSPLEGFMGEADLRSVVREGRLASGLAWTIPVVLDVDTPQLHGVKDTLLLQHEGQPLALLDVEGAYAFDPREIAQRVFGTTDEKHPGVARTYQKKPLLVAGKLRLLREPAHEYSGHYLLPKETRVLFEERGWRTVVGFQTRNVPHLGHEYVQKTALAMVDGLFVNPVIGRKKKGDFKDELILKSYEVLVEHYFPKSRVVMSILPWEMRYAGPREAIFHAIVRKNYGCTHFIVGRDHAGVGSYYSPYAAHEVFKDYPDLGITPMFFYSFFYCRKCLAVTSDKVCPHGDDQKLQFSGTLLRNIIASGKPAPYEMVRPEVSQLIIGYKEPLVA